MSSTTNQINTIEPFKITLNYRHQPQLKKQRKSSQCAKPHKNPKKRRLTETYDSINRPSQQLDNNTVLDIAELISQELERSRRRFSDVLECGIPMDLEEFELDAESPFGLQSKEITKRSCMEEQGQFFHDDLTL